jgi:hypothetical protein
MRIKVIYNRLNSAILEYNGVLARFLREKTEENRALLSSALDKLKEEVGKIPDGNN